MPKTTLNELGKLWAEHKKLQQAQKAATLVTAPRLRREGAENWGKITAALDSLVGE